MTPTAHGCSLLRKQLIGAFPGQNKRADMLSDGKLGVNGVCVTWQDRGTEGPERVGERSEARVEGLRTREKISFPTSLSVSK